MQHNCISIQIFENGRKSVSIEFPPQCPLFIVSNQSSFREWVVSNRMGLGGRGEGVILVVAMGESRGGSRIIQTTG